VRCKSRVLLLWMIIICSTWLALPLAWVNSSDFWGFLATANTQEVDQVLAAKVAAIEFESTTNNVKLEKVVIDNQNRSVLYFLQSG